MQTGSLGRLAGSSSPKVLKTPSCPSPVGKMPGSPVQKPSPHRSISTKVLLAEGEDTPFTEHCRHYEDSYRVRGLVGCRVVRPHPFLTKIQLLGEDGGEDLKDTAPLEDLAGLHSPLLQQGLQVEVQNLKDQVQELHRDLTKHHSLIKAEIMGDILHRSLLLDTQIASEYASMEGMRAVFQEVTSPRVLSSFLQRHMATPRQEGDSTVPGMVLCQTLTLWVLCLEKCGSDWCVWLYGSRSRNTISEILPPHLNQYTTLLSDLGGLLPTSSYPAGDL